jgi:hypothetical protein
VSRGWELVACGASQSLTLHAATPEAPMAAGRRGRYRVGRSFCFLRSFERLRAPCLRRGRLNGGDGLSGGDQAEKHAGEVSGEAGSFEGWTPFEVRAGTPAFVLVRGADVRAQCSALAAWLHAVRDINAKPRTSESWSVCGSMHSARCSRRAWRCLVATRAAWRASWAAAPALRCSSSWCAWEGCCTHRPARTATAAVAIAAATSARRCNPTGERTPPS